MASRPAVRVGPHDIPTVTTPAQNPGAPPNPGDKNNPAGQRDDLTEKMKKELDT